MTYKKSEGPHVTRSFGGICVSGVSRLIWPSSSRISRKKVRNFAPAAKIALHCDLPLFLEAAILNGRQIGEPASRVMHALQADLFVSSL